MHIDESDGRPIFLQVAEGIEDAILSGAFGEEEQIPSITEFSVTYTITPATALKGINLLVDAGILYKKRGVGMFVAEGAKKALLARRREGFYHSYAQPLAAEARRLALMKDEALAMTERALDEAERMKAE